jgi:cbb3-type cytochrome oxidase subunit 3
MSDVISRLDLATYPKIALVIFVVAFATILLRVFRRSRKSEYLHAAMLPVNDNERSLPGGDS